MNMRRHLVKSLTTGLILVGCRDYSQLVKPSPQPPSPQTLKNGQSFTIYLKS